MRQFLRPESSAVEVYMRPLEVYDDSGGHSARRIKATSSAWEFITYVGGEGSRVDAAEVGSIIVPQISLGGNQEVVTEIKFHTEAYAGIRLSDTDTFYEVAGDWYAAPVPGSSYYLSCSDSSLYLWKFDAEEDSITRLGSYSLSLGSRIRLRLRGSGTNLSGKAWNYTDPEPSWLITVTDSLLTTGQVFAGDNADYGYAAPKSILTQYLYWIGVADNDDTAPISGNLASISGQVTLGGAPVSGALVIAVRDGYDFSMPGVPGVDFAQATTDANGNYTISLDCDTGPYHVFAFYEEGGTKYTAEARPYISV